MRLATLSLASAALLTAISTPAQAQTAVEKADLRCILALSVAGRDPKNTASAQTGGFHFLGRLSARGQTARMGPLLISEAKAMNSPALIEVELKRCAAELNARGAELGTAMQELQKAGEAMRPVPPLPK